MITVDARPCVQYLLDDHQLAWPCAMQVEFGLPDLESRTQIFQIHTRTMNVERNIRFELLARLCPNSTGADIRSVCTEAGMFAIRNRCTLVKCTDVCTKCVCLQGICL